MKTFEKFVNFFTFTGALGADAVGQNLLCDVLLELLQAAGIVVRCGYGDVYAVGDLESALLAQALDAAYQFACNALQAQVLADFQIERNGQSALVGQRRYSQRRTGRRRDLQPRYSRIGLWEQAPSEFCTFSGNIHDSPL